jgi:hypothetical protein
MVRCSSPESWTRNFALKPPKQEVKDPMGKKKQEYTEEFKRQAIELSAEIGAAAA